MESLVSKAVVPKASSDVERLVQFSAHVCEPEVNVVLDCCVNAPDFNVLSERFTTAQAPDLNVENQDEFPKLSERFTTDQAPDLNVENECVLSDLSERFTTGQAPDLNAENRDDFPNLSERFTTNQTFESRQELIDWANGIGKGCGTVVVISKSDDPSYKKTPRLFLSCSKCNRKHTNRPNQSCPFQLRGVYIHDKKDKWKVEVHCGQHNHQLENILEDHSYVCRLKPDEVKLVKETKSALIRKHSVRAKPSKKGKLMNTRSSLADIRIEQFWDVMRPFIDNVHNVASDGHCGFRAVAAGLEMDSLCGWVTVREELIVELESFKEEYMRIFGGEKYLKKIHKNLGCTKVPCSQEFWFTLPAMGHLVASRYNVVFVCISQKHVQSFVSLRSPPPSEEPNVLAIGHVDRVHFVPIKLKSGCPIPQPVKVKANHKLAETWVNLLRSRSDAFRAIVGREPSIQEKGDEVDPIIVDLDCEGKYSDK